MADPDRTLPQADPPRVATDLAPDDPTKPISTEPWGRPVENCVVLEVLGGPAERPFHPVRRDHLFTIGRSEACDLSLDSAAVSRVHCRVIHEAAHFVFVEDCSLNGVFINDRKITGKETALPGDIITIGPFALRVSLRSMEEVAFLDGVNSQLRASLRDPTTGLLSRIELDRRWANRSEIYRRPSFACMLTIEDYSALEERFGTIAGDAVVQVVARLIKGCLPSQGLAFRYSSNEFALLIAESQHLQAALTTAERLAEAARRYDWSKISAGLVVRVLAGVAGLTDDETPVEALARAQRATSILRRQLGGRAPSVVVARPAQGHPPHGLDRSETRPVDPGAGGFRFYSCFISYCHEDGAFAEKLCRRLKDVGVACWMDIDNLVPGDYLLDSVGSSILEWERVVACCSAASVESWHVIHELSAVFDKERLQRKERRTDWRAVIPVDVDGSLSADTHVKGAAAVLRQRVIADFTGWASNEEKFERSLQRLLLALRADVSARGLPPLPG